MPRLLESLRGCTLPLDIIVVDCRSQDKTREVVEARYPHFNGESSLRFIESMQGISLQRNLGGSLARYETLLFCDADIAFKSPQDLETIIAEFRRESCVVAAPVMEALEERPDIQRFFRHAMRMQKTLLMLGRPYFAGSCIITTKAAFDTLHGFDERIPLGEDVDYSLRAAKLGSYRLIKTPVLVSGRRLIKYGYGWAKKETMQLLRFLITGRIAHPERIFYPFGEFGGTIKP